jgi:DNA repair protein RAD5
VLHPNLVLPSDEETTSGKGVVDVEALVKSLDEEGGEEGNQDTFAKSVLDGLGDDSPSECPICLDIIEERMLIPECMHQWYVYRGCCVRDADHYILKLQRLHRILLVGL